MIKNNKRKFNKILKNIKEIKIQGARNIARKALYAYFLMPTKLSKKKLLSVRPTEPMIKNVLDLVEKKSYRELLKHFDSAQNKINQYVFELIKKNDVIFTHCHSTNVVNALIYARKKGKIFEVYMRFLDYLKTLEDAYLCLPKDVCEMWNESRGRE